MRKLVKPSGKIRTLLILPALGLAACGATEKVDDVSRVERSDLVPSTTDIMQAAPKSYERRQAKTDAFSAELNAKTNQTLKAAGFDIDLEVVSFMVPNRIQAEISGARAHLSTNITLRNAASGDVLVENVAMTFVTPADGPLVTDRTSLVAAFNTHLEKSLQLR